jgi:hypothetical protein
MNLSRHEDITALATFYGPLCKTYAAMARDGLSLPQNLEGLTASGLALIATGTITAMHEFVNQVWVRRRDMPLALRRQVTRSYAVESLTSATVTLSGDTGVSDTFSVPPGTP